MLVAALCIAAFPGINQAAVAPLLDHAPVYLEVSPQGEADLPTFVDTVPYAPEEIRRLLDEGYMRYEPVRL